MTEPIVLQLQADCLDESVPISTLLRKAKLIASKLNLNDIGEWLENELNGYRGPLKDLPPYRIGLGMPKFFNPYHGWLDIVIADGELQKNIATCHLPQAIAEIEHLSSSSKKDFVILGFVPPINDFLHKNMEIEFNCGLHLSKTVLIGALEGIRNAVLEWTLALEREGVLGEGLSFSKAEIERAQMVTNHIYNSNVGVIGTVAGDSKNSHFVTSSGEVDRTKLLELVAQIRSASGGLPKAMAKSLQGPVDELESASKAEDKGRIGAALSAIKSVLEGAAGNLAAAGILSALGAG